MIRVKTRTMTARGLALVAAMGALLMAGGKEPTSSAAPVSAARNLAQFSEKPANSGTAQTMSEVSVVSHHPSGVPLHAKPRSPKVEARIANGTRIEVLGVGFEGRWLHVRSASGQEGWIARSYTRTQPRARRAASSAIKVDAAFASPELCRSALQTTRARARVRATGRIGSYNLRWFPDGSPGHRRSARASTDLEWLACAIASLDVDVLAIQEVKAFPRARALTRELMTRLDLLTGGRWQARIDDCPDSAELHVGFFYNSAKVQASHWQTLAELNPFNSACAKQLRPGLAGYFTFPGGLDLHIVSVHLKSTRAKRSLDLRARSLARLPAALSQLRAGVLDDDVLVVGDYNTMGCRDCVPPVSPGEELARISLALAEPSSRLRVVPSDAPCTQYSRGRPTRLDLFAAADSMLELLPASVVHVRGTCAELGCRRARAQHMPLAHQRLSDHCPLVLDLMDQDLD